MPVDSQSPKYKKYIVMHQKCRDAYEGELAVKAKTTTYLKPLSGQTASSPAYLARLDRAMFYAATGRTVEGLSGIVDRKPPTIDITDGVPWEDDIDGRGMSLHGFANQLVNEGVLLNWQGILVDRRKNYDYPYPIQYVAEQIINWYYDEDGELQMVMLHEQVEVMGEDYEIELIDQWRELTIIDGVYTVIIHRKEKGKFKVHDAYTPDLRGDALGTIPFVFVSSDNELKKPPLMDMIEVNFHHFKNSADYEHGLHFSGLPTAAIFGLQNMTDENGDNIPIVLGSETCIVSPTTGSAGYMEVMSEFTGLVTAMENKKLEMASLGAKMLQNDKKAVEAAETARINKSSDSNIISSIVTGVERGLNQALSIMSVWQGMAPAAATIELNRDYVDEGMSPEELTSLVGAMQARVMSKETVIYNIKKKDLLEDGRTIEEEMAAIDTEAPDLDAAPNFDDGE